MLFYLENTWIKVCYKRVYNQTLWMLFRRCPFSGFNLTVNGNPEVKKTWTSILILLYSLQAVFIKIPMVHVSIQINIHTWQPICFLSCDPKSLLLCTKIKTLKMWAWYRNVVDSLGADCAFKRRSVILFQTVCFAPFHWKVPHECCCCLLFSFDRRLV